MRSVLSVSLPEKFASDLDDDARKKGRNKSDIEEVWGQVLQLGISWGEGIYKKVGHSNCGMRIAKFGI